MKLYKVIFSFSILLFLGYLIFFSGKIFFNSWNDSNSLFFWRCRWFWE